ncbi:hypothetical protein JF66_15470 [Cryobacterium sp. MLB-32]|uniref:hypothetical protein n=1 Tax=Cryobacterium sp. MLB-32 TaxID=1529318 RepID=UPI0004E74B16|nr:hypothetical protein [Cryobacterium sp. MLB-32]KFF58851.1 hypothetical protein JF66_15470 [Cryobacterium sp. MLB-32]
MPVARADCSAAVSVEVAGQDICSALAPSTVSKTAAIAGDRFSKIVSIEPRPPPVVPRPGTLRRISTHVSLTTATTPHPGSPQLAVTVRVPMVRVASVGPSPKI